jgi:hypothetical protein
MSIDNRLKELVRFLLVSGGSLSEQPDIHTKKEPIVFVEAEKMLHQPTVGVFESNWGIIHSSWCGRPMSL